MFREIANEKGKKVSVNMYAPGGTGFVNHYVDPNVFNLLRSKTWDIVVLQPGSGESAGASYLVDTTIKRGRKILDSLYHYSPCAMVYLYQIPYGVPSASEFATYFNVQTIIRDSVGKMADSLHLQMIPAGECFRAYYSTKPNLFLHNSYNDIHPNANGSFLVAASMFTGIFQEEIGNCNYNGGINTDSAELFTHMADTIVLNHLAEWRINTFNLHAGYNYQSDGNTITFHSTSVNFISLSWNFGDGQMSSELQPSHTYQQDGSYPVVLTATSTKGCQDSSVQVIQVSATSLSDRSGDVCKIFSDPLSGNIVVSPSTANGDIDYNINLYDLSGKMVFEKTNLAGDYQITCNQFSPGLYLIRLDFQNKPVYTKKIQIIQ